MDVQSSSSYRIRALLQQLRPNVVEVLGTPDFRDCKAGHELGKHMDLLVDLYKQMIMETSKSAGKVVSKNRHLPQKIMAKKEDRKRKMKKNVVQPRHSKKKTMESGSSKTPSRSDKRLKISSRIEGSYTVGGSLSGWNFITFAGSQPVYYGVKKESYRSSHKQHGGCSIVIRSEL